MGLFGFGNKSMEERQDEAMKMVDKIGQGKGFTGRMTKFVMGSEYTDRVREASDAMHAAQQGAAAAAMAAQTGMPTTIARVDQVIDTGQSINDNPVVELALDIDGRRVGLRTMVSRLQIPRPGDSVRVIDNPNGGEPLYGGLAA